MMNNVFLCLENRVGVLNAARVNHHPWLFKPNLGTVPPKGGMSRGHLVRNF